MSEAGDFNKELAKGKRNPGKGRTQSKLEEHEAKSKPEQTHRKLHYRKQHEDSN